MATPTSYSIGDTNYTSNGQGGYTSSQNTSFTGTPVNYPPLTPVDTNNGIDTSTLKNNTNSLYIPPAPQDNTNYTAKLNGVVSGLSTNLTTANNNVDPLQQQSTDLYNRIASLQNSDLGKSADQTNLEAQANIPGQQKDIQELTNQITQLSASSQAIPLDAQNQATGRGITAQGLQTSVVNPETRANAIQALTLNAALQAKQGNLTLAQNQIQHSIDLKYKPIEDELNYKVQLLGLNKDQLTAAQAKQATAQQQLLTAQLQQVTNQKDTENAIGDIYTKAAQGGAPNSVLAEIQKSMRGGDLQGAYAAAGQYLQTNKYAFQILTDSFGNQYVVPVNTVSGQVGGGGSGGSGGSSGGSGGSGGAVDTSTTGTTGYYAPQNTAFKNAAEQMLAGTSPTIARPIRGQLNQLLSSGDTEGAKQFILTQAMQKFGPTETSNALGRLQAISALQDIQSSLNAYKAAGGDTNILKGNLETAVQKIGVSSDPTLAGIGIKISLAYNTYRKAVTGVAFSPQEAAQYAKIFPQITNIDSVNTTKIGALLDAFNLQQKTEVGAAIGQDNYDQLFGDTNPKSATDFLNGNIPTGTGGSTVPYSPSFWNTN